MERDNVFDDWWEKEPVSEFSGVDVRHVERAFAAGRKAERDSLAEQVAELRDCRICDHFTRASGGCLSTVQCINAQQLTVSKSRVKRYWEVKP